VGGLVKLLVVVNAEHIECRKESNSRDLRVVEAGRNTRHHDQSRQSMIFRDSCSKHPSGNLRIVPFNWKGDRRSADNPEVESVVGVLPNVLRINNQVFTESLLKTGVEFVAESWSQCPKLQVTPGGETIAAMTGSPQPVLAITKFSLNGVSMIRAYETLRTVFVGLML
jgi:hypothetical protein